MTTPFTNPKANWEQRFATEEFIFGEAVNDYLKANGHFLKPGNALAIADGEGRNSVWLAGQGLQVDAFDFAENAVEKAKLLAQKNQVEVNFVCSDWQSFDWKNEYYDNVVGIFFQFVNPADRALLFAKMHACLKPGGCMLIQGYTAEQLQFNTGGPGMLSHLYDAELMKELLLGYEFLDLSTYTAEINEGKAHKGMSGLLGLVAIKPIK